MSITADGKLSVVIGLTAIGAAGSIFAVSRWGFGTSPDSILYVAGARSLAAGTGFLAPSSASDPVPIAQFPPLFSALLAIFSTVGVDPLDGAAILNATLLGLSICLSAALVYRATGVPIAGFVAAAFTLTAPAILTTHTMVWSEPLFLFLLLLTALGIARYQETPSYASLLWIILPAGLAPLTRYAGVAVVIAASFTIGRKNLRHAGVFTMAASAGIVAWLARSYTYASNTAYRSIGFHPPEADQLNLGLQTIIEWFGGSLLLVAIAGLFIVSMMRRAKNVESRLNTNFLVSFAGVYVLLLVVIISFITAQIPLDRRILSPLYLVLSLWAIVRITAIALPQLRFAWSAMAILIVLMNSWTSVQWLNTLSTQGIGFSDSYWRFSPTMSYLKVHPVTPLHTNAPDPVYLLARIPATMLPAHSDPGTRVENRDYPKQISEVRKNGGIIVYFRAVHWRWYLPDEERLKAELGVRQIAELGDGGVYAINPILAVSQTTARP